MVRSVWVTNAAGERVLQEVKPTACPNGHRVVQRPGWTPHPPCGQPCRSWRCDECDAEQWDDEHVCR